MVFPHNWVGNFIPETNSSPLKLDLWKRRYILETTAYWGELFVLGSVIPLFNLGALFSSLTVSGNSYPSLLFMFLFPRWDMLVPWRLVESDVFLVLHRNLQYHFLGKLSFPCPKKCWQDEFPFWESIFRSKMLGAGEGTPWFLEEPLMVERFPRKRYLKKIQARKTSLSTSLQGTKIPHLGSQRKSSTQKCLLMGYGGFLKWWYPTTIGFPLGCFGGATILGNTHMLVHWRVIPKHQWTPVTNVGQPFKFHPRTTLKKQEGSATFWNLDGSKRRLIES